MIRRRRQESTRRRQEPAVFGGETARLYTLLFTCLLNGPIGGARGRGWGGAWNNSSYVDSEGFFRAGIIFVPAKLGGGAPPIQTRDHYASSFYGRRHYGM